jgi:leader peptidase (prepilin peptidase)/N-methyltransferase
MPDSLLLWPLAGLFGLLIGSFLNVCIYRWTRDLSVVKPRSACPGCGKTIAWYDNVPVLSFLLLRGKCRRCAMKISWMYPAVECLTGLAFAWFVAFDGLTLAAAKDCLFAAILIGLIFADLDTRLLPDEFTLGGLAAGLAFSLFVPLPPTIVSLFAMIAGIHPGMRVMSLGEAVLGAAVPAFAMWSLGWIFEKLRHREYLGFGDVKMIAMMGAFLGLTGTIVTLLVGSLIGSVGGYAWMKLTGRDPATYYLPFATFLGAGALIVIAAHGGITNWYSQLLQ